MLNPFTEKMDDGLYLSVYNRVIHRSLISLSSQEFLWPSQSLKRWELSQVLIVYQFPFALLIFNWGNINLFLFCISRKYGNHLRGKYIQNITMFKNLMANPKFSHFREQGNFISINYTSIEFSQALVCSFIRNSGNLHHSMLHLSAYLLYASCCLFNALSVHTQIFTTMVATVSCN